MGDADEVSLHDVASSPQFRETWEEDQDLQAVRMQALNTRDSQRGMPVGNSYFEVRNHLLYQIQKGSMAEQEGMQLVFPTQFHQVTWRLTMRTLQKDTLGMIRPLPR